MSNNNRKQKSTDEHAINRKKSKKVVEEILCRSPNQTFDLNYNGSDRANKIKIFNDQREKLRIKQIAVDYSRLVEFHYRNSSKYTISEEELVKKFNNRNIYFKAYDFYKLNKLSEKVAQIDEFEKKYGKETLKKCGATDFLDKKHLNLTFLSKSSLKDLLPTLRTTPVSILQRVSSQYTQSSQSSAAFPEDANPVIDILCQQEVLTSQKSNLFIGDSSQTSQSAAKNRFNFKGSFRNTTDYEKKSFCCRELSEGYIEQLESKSPGDPLIASFYKRKLKAQNRVEAFMPTVRAELSKMVYEEKRYHRPGYETPSDEFTDSDENYDSSDSDGNTFFRIALNRREALLGIESNAITRALEMRRREEEFDNLLEKEKEFQKAMLEDRAKLNGKPVFEDSFEIPLDFTLKDGVTLTSTFPFDFAGFTPKNKYTLAQMMAASSPIRPTHDLVTSTYDLLMKHPHLEGKRDTPATILSSLYSQLVTHQLPHPNKPSSYTQAQQDAIFNALSTRRNNRNNHRLSLNANHAVIQHFDNQVSLWESGFQNLFELVQKDLIPYFYYINDEFSVLFISKKIRNTLDKKAVVESGNDKEANGIIAMMYLKDCSLRTANALRKDGIKFSYVEHDEKVIQSVVYYTDSHRMSAPRGIDPPKEQRLVLQADNVQKIFKHALKWQNPNLKHHIRKLPSLISPLQFRGSHSVLPKLWYNEPRLFQASKDPFAGNDLQRKDSYEIQVEGIILPTALHQFTHLLQQFGCKLGVQSPYEPEAEFNFRVATALNTHTCAFFGRWMVSDPSRPTPKHLLDGENPNKPSSKNDFILLHNYLAGYRYKEGRFTWPREE